MVSFTVGKNKVNIINQVLRNLGEILKFFVLFFQLFSKVYNYLKNAKT